MRFDVAKIVIWIFELPLDQERRAASHPYLARLRTWLGSSRHRRRPKWIRSWRETACFPSTTQPVQESLSRFRSILNRITEVPTRQHVPFVIVGRPEASAETSVRCDRKRRRRLQSAATRSCPSRQARRTAEKGVETRPSPGRARTTRLRRY